MSITLAELKTLASNAEGSIHKIYAHWTAGHWTQQFNDYHILIAGDGTIYTTTDDFTTHLSHTYMRNTGGVSIGLMCMVGATTDNFGDQPLTDTQVEVLSQVVAVLCESLGLTIDINSVLTHAEAANNLDGENPGYEANGYPDGKYGPGFSCERWDLAILKPGDEMMSGGDTIRGKANWYRNQGV